MSPHDDDVAERSLDRSETGTVTGYLCANCRSPLETHAKHPVVTQSDDSPSVLLFCGSTCRATWLETERGQ